MNTITQLFNIKYPIIQGGMVWNSGYKLAAAVSNSGGLGLIGSGSMHPDILREHILKCQKATDKPFGVNIPLMYPNIEEIIHLVIELGVKIVFTSAGNPKTWTSFLKEKGITVVHVVSSSKFALKAQEAGVDAVVAEGFEAGGHNGKEETTTLVLIPAVKKVIQIPLIAAGGIATGTVMHAAMILGADGVQMGTRFALTKESSSHEAFKEFCIQAGEGDTLLTLKELGPVRMLNNDFFNQVQNAYQNKANPEQLKELLGKGRAKLGMLEGDLKEGLLEIGQVTALVDSIPTVAEAMKEIISDYHKSLNEGLKTSKYRF